MAIEKYTFLDEAGIQKLATVLLKATNTRIKERISTAIAAASYSDSEHTLAAQAILGLIGNISNYATMDGTGTTVLDKIKALDLAIGQDGDASTADTVYGAIQAVRERISGLTHLTYQVITGDIETEVPTADADTEVIYLQHDEPSMMVANDGFLMHDANTRASAEVGGVTYYAQAVNGVVYKVTEAGGTYTRTNETWDAGSEIYADGVVAMVEDTTYNLYVAIPVMDGETRTDINWLCVGDTSLDLSNYWSKKDSDVAELQNLLMTNISDAAIQSRVEAAFAATDPYVAGGVNYLATT